MLTIGNVDPGAGLIAGRGLAELKIGPMGPVRAVGNDLDTEQVVNGDPSQIGDSICCNDVSTDYFVVILDRAAMFPGTNAVEIDWSEIAGKTGLFGFSFTDFGEDDGGFPLNGTPGKTPPIISSEGEPFCVIAGTA